MKFTKSIISLSFFGLVFLNFLFGTQATADSKQYYDLYISGKAVFIDVREKDEVKDAMIKNALWFPLSKIEKDKKSEIEKIKHATQGKMIFVYCRSGNRSGKVLNYLEEAGIKSLNLGAFSDLVNENYPTQPGPQ